MYLISGALFVTWPDEKAERSVSGRSGQSIRLLLGSLSLGGIDQLVVGRGHVGCWAGTTAN